VTYTKSSEQARDTEENRSCTNSHGIHLGSLPRTEKWKNNPIFWTKTRGKKEAKRKLGGGERQKERLGSWVKNNKAEGRQANSRATSATLATRRSLQVPPISSDRQPRHHDRVLTIS